MNGFAAASSGDTREFAPVSRTGSPLHTPLRLMQCSGACREDKDLHRGLKMLCSLIFVLKNNAGIKNAACPQARPRYHELFLNGVDFPGQAGNFTGGVFLMDQAFCRSFGQRRNGFFQRVYRVFFTLAFNGRKNRLDFGFDCGLGGDITLPADLALTIAFFC